MSAKRTMWMLVLAASSALAQQPGGPPAGAPPSSTPAAEPAKTGSRPVELGKGKRDPFQSVVAPRGGAGAVLCTGTGKACMVASQVELKGVAKTQEGFIAMVVTGDKKTYFLRPNEPVLNGYVLKITGDSITFRENVIDNVGRTSTRDVVKRIVGSGI
ncbi:MAG: hypothetical protein L0099_05030 [Acidobacteria bacterium]|nr:hypothetical protein [Acidobacteriota bacterium]